MAVQGYGQAGSISIDSGSWYVSFGGRRDAVEDLLVYWPNSVAQQVAGVGARRRVLQDVQRLWFEGVYSAPLGGATEFEKLSAWQPRLRYAIGELLRLDQHARELFVNVLRRGTVTVPIHTIAMGRCVDHIRGTVLLERRPLHGETLAAVVAAWTMIAVSSYREIHEALHAMRALLHDQQQPASQPRSPARRPAAAPTPRATPQPVSTPTAAAATESATVDPVDAKPVDVDPVAPEPVGAGSVGAEPVAAGRTRAERSRAESEARLPKVRENAAVNKQPRSGRGLRATRQGEPPVQSGSADAQAGAPSSSSSGGVPAGS